MKKIVIFFAIIIIIIAGISYSYIIIKSNNNEIKQHNNTFEKYYQKEIYGSEIATIINKAIDSNTKNNIQKDDQGKYIENDTNSIKITIKMIDNETTYDMETIYEHQISEFVEYYNRIKFKCTNIQYHKKTNMVKTIELEQISV